MGLARAQVKQEAFTKFSWTEYTRTARVATNASSRTAGSHSDNRFCDQPEAAAQARLRALLAVGAQGIQRRQHFSAVYCRLHIVKDTRDLALRIDDEAVACSQLGNEKAVQ